MVGREKEKPFTAWVHVRACGTEIPAKLQGAIGFVCVVLTRFAEFTFGGKPFNLGVSLISGVVGSAFEDCSFLLRSFRRGRERAGDVLIDFQHIQGFYYFQLILRRDRGKFVGRCLGAFATRRLITNVSRN